VLPLLTLLALHPLVTTEGGTTCPTPADVARELTELMASVPDDVAQDRALLRSIPGGLHLDLRRDDGARIAERDLSSSGRCADLASAAAVIIATWEVQLQPQRMGRTRLPTTAVSTQAPVTAPAAPARQTLDLDLGGLGSLAGGQWVPGAVLAGSWAPRPQLVGLYAAVAAAGTRSQDVTVAPGATASWTRGSLALGSRVRLASELVRADAHAAALGGLLHLAAGGLSTPRSKTVAALGMGAGVRVSPAWRVATPWIGVDAQVWPGHEYLQVMTPNGLVSAGELPRFELLLEAGVSLGRFF
jgi:hypothetical protein